MPPQIIIPAVFALIVIISWFINTYNKFIKYKNRIEESWSGIDVALKRRFNLIPNLVNSIGEYGKHEASIIEKISDNHELDISNMEDGMYIIQIKTGMEIIYDKLIIQH